MASVTFGVFGERPEERQRIASALAKRSNPEDITLYHTVFSGKIITAIEPTAYPEKAPPLVYAGFLSDYCIVVAQDASQALGEIIITLDLLGKEDGCIISNLQLENFVGGTALENYKVFPSFELAKEEILKFVPNRGNSEDVFAAVDHSFEVKGVGSILLGFLHSGKIRVHDKLMVHPSGKQLEVRSIQMHDEDVSEADAGDRFGLAIKSLASRDVERGDLVSARGDGMLTGKEIECMVSAARFLKGPLEDGEQVHAMHFLESAPCRWKGEAVHGGKSGRGMLVFEKPFAANKVLPILLCRLDAKGLRIIGKAFPWPG